MKRIAIWTKKGGVAKTTTAANIGYWLSQNGFSVCLVDADSQYNLSTHLGVPQSDITGSLADVMSGKKLEDVIIEVRENLAMIPSNQGMADFNSVIAKARPPELAIKRRFADIVAWDYLIFDCPPGSGLLVDNVLCYCDEVWSPLEAAFFSYDGLTQVTSAIESLQADFPHDCNVKLTHIIPTKFDGRTGISREVVDLAKETFGTLVTNVVRKSVKVEESPSHGLTVLEYAANSTAAQDYSIIAKELVHG